MFEGKSPYCEVEYFPCSFHFPPPYSPRSATAPILAFIPIPPIHAYNPTLLSLNSFLLSDCADAVLRLRDLRIALVAHEGRYLLPDCYDGAEYCLYSDGLSQPGHLLPAGKDIRSRTKRHQVLHNLQSEEGEGAGALHRLRSLHRRTRSRKYMQTV